MSPQIPWFCFVLLFFGKVLSGTSQKKKLLCYYDKESEKMPEAYRLSPAAIDGSLCTHLLYIMSIDDFLSGPFLTLSFRLGLSPVERTEGIADLLKRYPDLKLMLSIGGWNEGSARYSMIVSDPGDRTAFIQVLCSYIRDIGFHGVDINWQWPTLRQGGKPENKQDYSTFITELKRHIEKEAEKTKKPALLLSVALPPFEEVAKQGFEISTFKIEADILVLMTMDYYLSTDPVINHHAPLFSVSSEVISNSFSVDSSVEFYLKLGVDASKIILGIPLFGRSYILDSEYNTRIGSIAEDEGKKGFATNVSGTLAYFEICTYILSFGWRVEHPNPTSMGPYAFKQRDWVAFDDQDIITKKVEYVHAKGLGGVMLWSIDMDDSSGKCFQGRFPLVKAASQALQSYNETSITDTESDEQSDEEHSTVAQTEDSSCRFLLVIQEEEINRSNSSDNGKTLAHKASEQGDLATLQCLVSRGANLNVTDLLKRTPLHLAAQKNELNILRYLVMQSIDMNSQDRYNYTALYITSLFGYLESFKVLLESGADPFIGPNCKTSMHVAAENNHPLIIRELNKRYRSMVELKDAFSETPISLAAVYGHTDAIKELVDLGAEIHPSTMHKAIASFSPNIFFLKFLVSIGGDVNSKDEHNVTLLIRSIQLGRSEIVKFLLDSKADIHIKSDKGRTVLQEALLAFPHEPKNSSIVERLLENNVDINSPDRNGDTSLNYSRLTRNGRVCKLLLARGAEDGPGLYLDITRYDKSKALNKDCT